MINKIITKLAIFALKKELSPENKSEIMNALIDNLKMLPISAIIRIESDGNIYIGDELLESEKAIQLRESAAMVLNSQVRKFIGQQMNHLIVNVGVHQATNAEQVLFAKAAIWARQEEEKLLNLLAQ